MTVSKDQIVALQKATETELLAQLRRIRRRMERDEARAKDIAELREAIWREGRRRTPAVTQQALADASGVSDVYVARATK